MSKTHQLRLPIEQKGLCKYCWRQLRTEESIKRGYGLRCKKKHVKPTTSEVVKRYIEREAA